jgi:hypothetical protein
VESEDIFERGSRVFRVDGADGRTIHALEIVMETFQDESTPEELIRLLDNGGYHQRRSLPCTGKQAP